MLISTLPTSAVDDEGIKTSNKSKASTLPSIKKATSDSDWEEYKRKRNRVCTFLKNAKSNYVSQATSESAKASEYRSKPKRPW